MDILLIYAQILKKDLFKLLKEIHGEKFNSFISEKVTVVPGDISQEEFNLKDPNLVKELYSEINVIVNLAATTNFDERYNKFFGIMYYCFGMCNTVFQQLYNCFKCLLYDTQVK